MRLFAHRTRREYVCSGLIAIVLAISGAPVSRGQEAGSKPSARMQPEEQLAVGTEVVFARAGCSLTNRERLARTAFPPPYFSIGLKAIAC